VTQIFKIVNKSLWQICKIPWRRCNSRHS